MSTIKRKADNDAVVLKDGSTMSGQLNFSGTTHAGVKLLSLTTAQRDALTPADGMLIYNSTTNAVNGYINGSWQEVSVSVAGGFLPLSGGTMTGGLGMSSQSITGTNWSIDGNGGVSCKRASIGEIPLLGFVVNVVSQGQTALARNCLNANTVSTPNPSNFLTRAVHIGNQSQTPGTGIGAGMAFYVNSNGGLNPITDIAAIDAITSDATTSSEDSFISFKTITAGTLAERATLGDGAFTLVDAYNFAVGTTTGTKIGTATNQKLGFWNATPVVQPSTTGTATGFTAGSGTAVKEDSTFTGGTGSKAYTIGDIVKALKDTGLMAAS